MSKTLIALLTLSLAPISFGQDRQAERALEAEIVASGGRVTPGFAEVYLVGEQVTDDLLGRLMPHGAQLGMLSFKNTSVSTFGFRKLVFLPKLRTVHVYENEIKAGALKSLATAKQLTTISVKSPALTDQDLADLSKLKWITGLSVELTSKTVTPKGLSQLATMKLTALSLKGKKGEITDEHLGALTAIGSLERLFLTQTVVTDKGLMALPKLKKLNLLHVAWSEITNDGLLVFAEMPELRTVHLVFAKTTSEARAIMKKNAPHVRFEASSTR
jgi:hypothetical protein